MLQIYFTGAKSIAYIIYSALGASLVSIPIWILIGGYLILPFVIAIINLFKPDNKIKLDHWRTASFGVIIGIFLKLVFNIKF
jgi:hypothetical protein